MSTPLGVLIYTYIFIFFFFSLATFFSFSFSRLGSVRVKTVEKFENKILKIDLGRNFSIWGGFSSQINGKFRRKFKFRFGAGTRKNAKFTEENPDLHSKIRIKNIFKNFQKFRKLQIFAFIFSVNRAQNLQKSCGGVQRF